MTAQAAYAEALTRFCDTELAKVTAYQTNRQSGKVAALKQNFPFTLQILEAELFLPLAVVYQQHYPSEHWDINLYGEQFPGFIRAQAKGFHATRCNWRFIAQVAAFEYGVLCCYYRNGFTGQYPLSHARALLPELCKHHPWLVCDFDLASVSGDVLEATELLTIKAKMEQTGFAICVSLSEGNP